MPKYINAEDFKAKYLCCGYLPEMSEEEFDAFPGSDFEADERPHCGAEVKTFELKPCPFCGGDVEESGGTCNYGKHTMILRLKCKKCGTGYSFKSKWVSNPYFETVEAWNRRCEK